MTKISQSIRVLVVDDSAFMRNRLSMMLMKCADLQVVGTAKNGQEAIEQVHRTQPDVMTLDFEMPEMNGLEVLDHLMIQRPLPIIMVSAQTAEGAEVTLQALERGAVDFIAKPLNQDEFGMETMEKLLHRKVREAFKVNNRFAGMSPAGVHSEKGISHPIPTQLGAPNSVGTLQPNIYTPRIGKPFHETSDLAEFPVVVIGASTGGPNLLQALIHDLPATFPGPLVIVQHMPAYFTKVFAEKLNAMSSLSICEAQNGDELRPGMGFVAPGDHHVGITRQPDGRPRICFLSDREDQPYRPSIDCAMASAVEQFGANTVGLVLTGMGDDGLEGSRKIRERGGIVLVQNESTSLIYGMPRVVVEAGLADAVIPDVHIARALVQVVESMYVGNA